MGSGDGRKPEPFQGPEEPGRSRELGSGPGIHQEAQPEIRRVPARRSACPARRSGNTLAGRVHQPGSALATRKPILRNMAGSPTTRVERRTRWERRSRTRGGSTTCTATFGSGAPIGMTATITRNRRQAVQPGRPSSRRAFFAAARGATRLRIAAQPRDTACRRGSAFIAMGCAWRANAEGDRLQPKE